MRLSFNISKLVYLLVILNEANDAILKLFKARSTIRTVRTEFNETVLPLQFSFRKQAMPDLFSQHLEIFLTLNKYFSTTLMEKEKM